MDCSARPPITVITGAEAHPTLYKALGVVGLGRIVSLKVPVDSQGRIRTDAMPRINGPTIVCAQSGNVNTGAFDPAGEICDYAHDAGAFVHIDGAFGLWARRDKDLASLGAGIERAESWGERTRTDGSTCPTTAASRSCATRDALRAAMAVTAEVSADGIGESQSIGLHAGTVAASARRGSVGGAARARTRRRGRDGGSPLPASAAICRTPRACRFRDLE